jgi:hypothetical protein
MLCSGQTPRLLREGLAVGASLIVCLALVETGSYLLSRNNERRSLGGRNFMYDLPAKARLLQWDRPRKSLEIPNSQGALPVINPNPVSRIRMPFEASDHSREVHPIRGYFGLLTNGRTRAVLAVAGTGQPIYDVVESTDGAARRTTLNPRPERRKKHLLLLGCSFVFGPGLMDSETLASQLALRAPLYRAYNYGVSAMGPGDVLKLMRGKDIAAEVPERGGWALYFHINEHFRRIEPRLSQLGWPRSYFREGPGPSLLGGGLLEQEFPWRARFLGLLGGVQILKLLKLDFPWTVDEHAVRLAALIYREMKREYERQLPGGRFAVVVHPLGARTPLLSEYLDYFEVPYLVYDGLTWPKVVDGPVRLSLYDAHPSAATNRLLAKLLARDLGLDGKPRR